MASMQLGRFGLTVDPEGSGSAAEVHAAGTDHAHLTVLSDADQPTGLAAARALASALGPRAEPRSTRGAVRRARS